MSQRVRLAFSLTAVSAGIAIFSMFFGAGNVIFPLSVGQTIGENINYAMMGLLITAIGAPLLGLFSTILFNGDCKQFFSRIGEIPAYLLVILIIAIIGPFGAMPRCFTVAHNAVLPYLDVSLFVFSLLAGLTVLLTVFKRHLILPILGMVLSPLLLLALFIIIAKGLMTTAEPVTTGIGATDAFFRGFHVGYDTMDMLASMFFAVVVWDLLKEKFQQQGRDVTPQNLAPICFMASLIGGGLLGFIYVGLSKVSAVNMQALADVPQEALLSQVAILVLGERFAFIANIAIALACLTTVISLAATVADVLIVEFKSSRVGNGRVLNYNALIVFIVIITILFSNLGFKQIMEYLHPIVAICYPAIIVLAVCNILYKLFGFTWVKTPVYLTIAASLAFDLHTRFLV